MPHELPKAYDPSAIESRWAEYWVHEKLFSVATPKEGEAEQPVFTLLLPPPNVTGRLHMGHMLNQTEMDVIVRWHRMRGFLTLWLPGTDHAGIATQMMVERQLAAEGKNRRDLGREQFIERVWDWKRHYGGAILDQMKRLGASVDWDREYFTMDDRLSRAVREAFVTLYEEGLIYRGKYIVNWCPRCVTAISDLEVVHEETQGKLYEVRYPVVRTDEFIVVATTRPETMLGDTAVAVNPKDERYRHLHGKMVRLPLLNRDIPIILDELANPEFGTGAVKVTPAHDPNDFQAGLRHLLPQINVMDEFGRMNEEAGPYAGLDRFEARERVLQDLQQLGYLVGIKDHVLAIGKCDRCKTIVEPRASTQWFVKIQPLADRAIEAVERGEITFTPDNYSKTYFEWMRNIHDWCISRQLWWGHRIPAWHCAECRSILVAREAPKKCTKCGSERLEQDTDVLDTWFSSGLLPFSALGWPDKTPELNTFYPTSLLLTGFDILFFWVARMIMLGCHFMKDHEAGNVPFRQVYIHALVRDAERQKMSKTKGNVLDPISVIEKFGTDATRFTLAAMAAPGTDIAFSESRTESYRAFANKIWNAARFIFMNVDKVQEEKVWSLAEFRNRDIDPNAPGLPKFTAIALEDKWLLSRFNRVSQQVHEALAAYRFHEAAHVIYHFFWGEFCDWYIELVKPRLAPATAEERVDARIAFENIVSVFEGALRLLSPFMPFITEEIWHAVYDGQPTLKSIALARYPQADPTQMSDVAETEMAIVQDLIVSVRNLRAELKVEQRQKLPIEVFTDAEVRKLVERNRGSVERLANVETITFVNESLAKASHSRSTARFDVRVIYEQKIDVAAELERVGKDIAKMEGELSNAQRQLGNEQFLSKAPTHVVAGIRKREGELHLLLEKARAAVAELETKK
ncbi:MAG TPA: valine--tRNA ligase [Clostridia bacterium]|nr:valine--tRNA ligase [Clostridia bacterium]